MNPSRTWAVEKSPDDPNMLVLRLGVGNIVPCNIPVALNGDFGLFLAKMEEECSRWEAEFHKQTALRPQPRILPVTQLPPMPAIQGKR